MFAKPVSEEGEQTRDEPPRLVRSSLVLIICKAKVLHKSDEEELIRFIEKLRYTHGIENFTYYTEKFRVIFYHVLLTAGIAGGIVFATLLLHNVTIFMHEEIPPKCRGLGTSTNCRSPYLRNRKWDILERTLELTGQILQDEGRMNTTIISRFRRMHPISWDEDYD
jgi:hypothetical protein